MDLLDIVMVAFRRWYAVVPILIVGVVAASFLYVTADSLYEMRGSYLLSDSPLLGVGESAVPGPGEPDEDEGIIDASLVSAVINLDGRRGPAEQPLEGGGYEATALGDDVLRIDAWADSPDEAEGLLGEAAAAVDQILDDGFQARAVSSTRTSPTAADDPRGAFQGTALLRISSIEGGREALGNDYTLRILTEVMRSSRLSDQILLQDDDDLSGYTVERRDRDAAPVVEIQASASDPDRVAAIYERTAEFTQATLVELQESEGVADRSRVGLAVIVDPEVELVDSNAGLRPAVVVLGLSGVLALGMALALEGIGRRRRLVRATSFDAEASLLSPNVEDLGREDRIGARSR